MADNKIYRFIQRTAKYFSEPQKSQKLLREIVDICEEKENLKWSILPDHHKITKLKWLIRTAVLYSQRAEDGTHKMPGEDFELLRLVKKRVRTNEFATTNFYAVYRCMRGYIENMEQIPNPRTLSHVILGRMINVEARDYANDLKRKLDFEKPNAQKVAKAKMREQDVDERNW